MEALASSATGVLVGVLLGSIESSSLGGLSAVIVAVMSLLSGVSRPAWLAADTSDTRVLAFSACAVVAYLSASILQRSGAYDPSLATQVKIFRDVGFTDGEARNLAVQKYLGSSRGNLVNAGSPVTIKP